MTTTVHYDTREAKRSEALAALAEQVELLKTSDGWQSWLAFAARLHSYSFNNTLLIQAQCPQATHVMPYGNKAGTTGWKSVNRQVRKGESGLMIFAPLIKSVENDKDRRLVGFRMVSVFDVSQTDGEPLPEDPTRMYAAARRQTNGDAADWELITRAAQRLEIAVAIERDDSEHPGAYGWTLAASRSVHVVDTAEPGPMAKTLLHELAHALDDDAIDNRAEREVVAESVAWLVGQQYGIDSSPCSTVYLVSWGADTERVAQVGPRVLRIAKQIDDAVAAELHTMEGRPVIARDAMPTTDDVLAALDPNAALTVAAVAERAFGVLAWRHRTNVRNRLYELEAMGLAICDEGRPQRWTTNALHLTRTAHKENDMPASPSNYPPGVTGNEPQIVGYPEGTQHVARCGSTIRAERVTILVDWKIKRQLIDVIPNRTQVDTLRIVDDAATSLGDAVDEIDCPYAGGEIDGFYDSDGVFIWTCPVCGGANEADPQR